MKTKLSSVNYLDTQLIKRYKLWDPIKCRVIISRNVTFNELNNKFISEDNKPQDDNGSTNIRLYPIISTYDEVLVNGEALELNNEEEVPNLEAVVDGELTTVISKYRSLLRL